MEVSSQTKKKINNLKLRAFTLAEVLIVIGIIGTIANLTIPSLLKNVSEQQAKVAWKKKYSEINQIIKRMDADYLIPFSTYSALFNSFGSNMLHSKKCNLSISEGCWHTKWYSLEGVKISTSGFDAPGYILNDGSLFIFPAWVTNTVQGNQIESVGNQIHFFVIDVNGFKGPNKQGYDIFGGFLARKGIELSDGCDRNEFIMNTHPADMGCSKKVILGEDY